MNCIINMLVHYTHILWYPTPKFSDPLNPFPPKKTFIIPWSISGCVFFNSERYFLCWLHKQRQFPEATPKPSPTSSEDQKKKKKKKSKHAHTQQWSGVGCVTRGCIRAAVWPPPQTRFPPATLVTGFAFCHSVAKPGLHEVVGSANPKKKSSSSGKLLNFWKCCKLYYHWDISLGYSCKPLLSSVRHVTTQGGDMPNRHSARSPFSVYLRLSDEKIFGFGWWSNT